MSQRRGRQTSTEVNIAPLIDMVFILLIFFLVTTTFSKEAGINVEKPQAASGQSLEDDSVRTAVTAEGEIFVEGRNLETEELSDLIRDKVAQKPNVLVVIIPDKDLSSGRLVKIMDVAKLAGAKNVAIATQRIERN